MICESTWHHCVIWKVWMVRNSVWFIEVWRFCGNILIKIMSIIFSTVKERCDDHARMTELNVNTKTQYCSCLLQNFERTVYATLCNVAYSPIRTYRFFKNNITYAYSSMAVHLYCHRFFLIFQHNPLGTMPGYFLI